MTVVPRTEELIAAPASVVVVAGPRTDVGVCPCGLFSKCTNLRHSTIGCTVKPFASLFLLLRYFVLCGLRLSRLLERSNADLILYPLLNRCLDPAAVKSIFLYQQQSYSVRRAEASLLLTA